MEQKPNIGKILGPPRLFVAGLFNNKMFEGFPDGPWEEEVDSPPPNPEWWEILIVALTLALIAYSMYQWAVYGF